VFAGIKSNHVKLSIGGLGNENVRAAVQTEQEKTEMGI